LGKVSSWLAGMVRKIVAFRPVFMSQAARRD
jgi:hypothetical protein